MSVSGTSGRQSWYSASQSAAPPPSVLKISNTVALPYIPARTPFAEKRVFWHSILPWNNIIQNITNSRIFGIRRGCQLPWEVLEGLLETILVANTEKLEPGLHHVIQQESRLLIATGPSNLRQKQTEGSSFQTHFGQERQVQLLSFLPGDELWTELWGSLSSLLLQLYAFLQKEPAVSDLTS